MVSVIFMPPILKKFKSVFRYLIVCFNVVSCMDNSSYFPFLISCVPWKMSECRLESKLSLKEVTGSILIKPHHTLTIKSVLS